MARGVALVPFNGTLAIPDWTTPQFWPFINSTFSAPVVLAPGSPGISSAAADGSGGMWLASYAGKLWHQTATGAVPNPQPLPQGQIYIGVSPSGHVLSASGIVFTAATTQLGSFPTPAIGSMVSSGTTMMAILPASGIGLMSSGGVTGRIAPAAAMPVISCIMASAGVSLAAGGWITALSLSGAVAAALDPQNPEIMLAVGSGHAFIWSTSTSVTGGGPLSENWSQSAASGQLLTGLANLNSMCWSRNGVQALATSLSAGDVQVLGFSAGVLSLLQTIPVVSGCSVAVAGTQNNAIVAQSGRSQVTTLTETASVWSSGAVVSGLPGVSVVVPFGTTGVVANYSGGIAYLGFVNGTTWVLQKTLPLGFAPTVVTVDPFLQIYAAGNGNVAVCSGMVPTGSGSFTGTPNGIAVQQGRLILSVPGSGLAILGNTAPGKWTQQGSQSGAFSGLALSNTVLFAMGSGATQMFGFSGTPYALTPVVCGVAGLWNGSAWTTTGLGIGHNPSAIGFDASGNIWLATVQNTLWNLNPTGGVISASGLPQLSPQPQSVPLGPSAILAASGGVFVATSLSGLLIQVR